MSLPIAVVVATYRRPGDVSRLLSNLTQQRCAPAAVRIVDASPDEETRGVVETFAPRAPWPLRWERARVRGLPSQRIQGVEGATAPLVCFLDDDVVLDPGFLEAMAESFDGDGKEDLAGACGYFTNGYRPLGWRWALRRALAFTFPLEPGRYYANGHSCPLFCVPPFDGLRPMRYICGGLTVYRRRIFDEFDFPPLVRELYRLGLGKAEDLHLSLRVGARYRLAMQGSARAQHLHTPTGRSSPYRSAFAGSYAQALIFRTCRPYRPWIDEPFFWQAQAVDLLVGLVGCLFDGEPDRWAGWRGRWDAARFIWRRPPGRGDPGEDVRAIQSAVEGR